MVRRETPIKRASLSCVNPAPGKTSSRKISPGCVGLLFRLFRQFFAIVPVLVIVLKINIERVFAFKSERHAPVAADGNAPCAGAIALELMQSITRQVHICWCARVVEDVELSSQTGSTFGSYS